MPEGIVIASQLNFRESAGGALIASIPKGEKVEILENQGEWLRIRRGDQEGFVSARYVTVSAEPQKGVVTASSLNVRDGQSTDSAIVGSLPKGSGVEILEDLEEWLKIAFDGGEAYVSEDHVEKQAARIGRVTADKLNVRESPVDGKVVGSLQKGAEVEIFAEQDDWLSIEADGELGFVAKQYVAEGEEAEESEPPPAPPIPEGFRVDGRNVLGPDAVRFATTYKLGVFNSGETSIGDYVTANADAFPDLKPKLSVMQAVSANEGNLEAINTWDNAFLTFGAFQWTVGSGDGAGELPALLDRLLQTDADIFEALFGQYGLGVTDVVHPDSSPGRGYFTLNGDSLRTPTQKEQLRSLVWAYRFGQAGGNDSLRRVQIAHAAGRVDLFYRSDRKHIRDRPIADYVTSEFGVALLLDQHVNRPGHVPKVLAAAVDAYVGQLGADDPDGWETAQEAQLLDIYLNMRDDTSMTDSRGRAERTRSAVDKGLASAERGSYKA